MTTHGGARPGAGRPKRQEPKALPVWCGQISEQDRALILERLTPQERYAALMGAAQKERVMNEYFECVNCGQVVQGWNASQMVQCCEFPQHKRIEGPEQDDELYVPVPRPTDEDAELFAID